jgi:succinyl-diaminopimelate desuccinylase
LHNTVWDNGNEHFPPTSFQFVQLQSDAGAPNVTPSTLAARFNFRYSTEWNYTSLQRRVHELFDAYDIDYELRWRLSGEPFLTMPGRLTRAASDAVREIAGLTPELSTGGGTSDGRFIAPGGADVVELGAVNDSIHKVNEYVTLEDVGRLTAMYRRIAEKLLLD